MTKFLKLLCVIFTAFTLNACGFQLREPINNTHNAALATQLKTMYISTTTPNDPFVQQLTRLLTANGINLVNNPTNAQSILNILSINSSNSLINNGGINFAGSYTASLSVTFNVALSDGNLILPDTTLEQSQNFVSNASQVLSANNTASQLINSMQQQLAQSLLNQLTKINISTQP